MALTQAVTASVGGCDVDVYPDEIRLYLDDYTQDCGVESPDKLSSQQWAGAMMDIGFKLFKDKPILKIQSCPNQYNPDTVNRLCDVYIWLCYKYNQRICLEHFSMLSGIDMSIIHEWKNKRSRSYIYRDLDNNVIAFQNTVGLSPDQYSKIPTSIFADIHKKLVQNTMTAADDIMLSRSGVNSIAYRNAVQERYAQRQDTGGGSVDVVGLADQLGIASDVRGLIGANSDK
jgi:hypothetical protein